MKHGRLHRQTDVLPVSEHWPTPSSPTSAFLAEHDAYSVAYHFGPFGSAVPAVLPSHSPAHLLPMGAEWKKERAWML